jgi:diadenosine tetraphosphate (Ap4A) HIT family hydrolase
LVVKRRPTHANCLYCDWIEDEHFELKEGYRLVRETKDYLVILDIRPKVRGHTLLISTQQLDDITQLDPDSAHAKRLFRGIVETSKLLKEKLTGKDGKVYVMTMCEHWKASELKSSSRTTEHLHFHLLPRYRRMRTKRQAMEHLLQRRGRMWSHARLRRLRNKLVFPQKGI